MLMEPTAYRFGLKRHAFDERVDEDWRNAASQELD